MFGRKKDKTKIISEPSEEMYEAVSKQLQHRWFSLSASFFDSSETVESKQRNLDELKNWVKYNANNEQDPAYQRWIDAAQYTITKRRSDILISSKAKNIELPKLP